MTNNIYQRGISITEVSVVILIIALLAGVVSAGIGAQKASEMRSFISQIQSMQSAVESFEHKYDELPGDMIDAHDFWTTNCDATASNCNGNSDGQIELAAGANDNESFRAWQHLTLGAFIENSYNGIGGGTGQQSDLGVNVPTSRRSKVGYVILWDTTGAMARNEIQIGGFKVNAALDNSALTPKEALALDRKLDDGLPYAGLVAGEDGADATAQDCVDDGADNTINTRDDKYTVATDQIACRLSFFALP